MLVCGPASARNTHAQLLIKTVFTSRNDRGINGGGEGANAAAPVAIAAAFFDATGVMPRRIPLTPAYVKSLLKA